MPHFFAKSLDLLEFKESKKCSGKYVDFLLEAKNVRDDSVLILAESKDDSHSKIMLLKQKKGDKFLVKFNKHFRIQSRETIKNALKDYANLTNANIISHNLNAHTHETKSPYLLDSQGILEILGDFGQNISHFKNPKMLEIGFGSGRHILHLAQNNPNSLIIGLEIYRPAILQVLRQIEILNLTNLFIASIDARVLFEVIESESLTKIFLHFPVPWENNPQRRVLNKYFLANAMRTLNAQCGRFELITDSKEYFDFAKKLAKIYRQKSTINPQNAVVSKYEARWIRLKKDIYKLEIFPKKCFPYMFFTQFKAKNVMPNAMPTLKLDLAKIRDLNYPKVHKKEYFLQLKDKYEFSEGIILYVVFGAYFAPNSAYIIIKKERCEILGDIIATNANLAALNELVNLFGSDL